MIESVSNTQISDKGGGDYSTHNGTVNWIQALSRQDSKCIIPKALELLTCEQAKHTKHRKFN